MKIHKHVLERRVMCEYSPTLLTDIVVLAEALPWYCWTLLFQDLDVIKLHSLSSSPGLKHISLLKKMYRKKLKLKS